jgi:hypothetical protein
VEADDEKVDAVKQAILKSLPAGSFRRISWIATSLRSRNDVADDNQGDPAG